MFETTSQYIIQWVYPLLIPIIQWGESISMKMFETTNQIRENHVNKEHVFWILGDEPHVDRSTDQPKCVMVFWSMYGNIFF